MYTPQETEETTIYAIGDESYADVERMTLLNINGLDIHYPLLVKL